ncbi:MAG: glycoside hydrolase family 9 protein [Clostridiales bacterium]|nr:glycoside hydrolase family 9 protein [Clostridiales bacterium]
MKYQKIIASVLCLSMLTGCSFVEEYIKSQDPDQPGKVTDTTSEGSSEETSKVTNAGTSESTTNPDYTGTVPEDPAQESAGSSASDSEGSSQGLSEKGSGYEGIEGTGLYNYGEALQKSLLFYELQRSGDLPDETRCNWRGDSGMSDGSDNGIDLTGGWYDAGDHVKFNLPMAYSAAVLAWSVTESEDAYKEAGQLDYVKGDIKWVTDYLIKCHPDDNTYYYQVGDGGSDHSWWGPAEAMSMSRPSYKVTMDNPGSAVAGEAAAALASASIVFAASDKAYSDECLKHAKSLYKFADETRSDAGYTAANGFYDSWSGFYDELAWAGAWLYLATEDKTYLDNAKSCYSQANQDYNWSMCWDDVHIGAAVLLAKITGEKTYTDAVERYLDFWCSEITYSPKGLAWLDTWGSLRYATTTAFVAAVYADSGKCDAGKTDKYQKFAQSQIDYALGSSGRSFVVGFGENPPEHPHHRTAQGSYSNNMNEPSEHRHTLYGALVGGPDANDGYNDTVSDYTANEVACDYNAGFTGILAKMYGKYHGKTIKDFGAVEPAGDEYSVEGSVNVDGQDFIEIKALVYNKTAWPARKSDKLELRYFVDLSEVKDPGSLEVTSNYMQSGRVDGMKPWNKDKNLYYLSVVFDDGNLYPGGQEHYKSEIQVRMRNPDGAWDNSNDPSYKDLAGRGICLYDAGRLVWGNEPSADGKDQTPVTDGTGDTKPSGTTQATDGTAVTAATGKATDKAKVTMKYDSRSGNCISGSMEIKNTGKDKIDLKSLNVRYFFVCDKSKSLVFDCYYSGLIQSDGAYSGVNGVTGKYEEPGKATSSCNKILTMSLPDAGSIGPGGTLTINFSIHYSDWQNMDSAASYSLAGDGNIVVESAGTNIWGSEPQ